MASSGPKATAPEVMVIQDDSSSTSNSSNSSNSSSSGSSSSGSSLDSASELDSDAVDGEVENISSVDGSIHLDSSGDGSVHGSVHSVGTDSSYQSLDLSSSTSNDISGDADSLFDWWKVWGSWG